MSAATLEDPANASLTASPAPAVDAAVMEFHQNELRGQGYTIFRDIITPSQLADMRRTIDQRVAQMRTENHEQNYHGVNLVVWHPAFADVATNPLLLKTVDSLIGDDCILSSCNLGARIPGCEAQGLHRDTGIWGGSMPFMTFPVGIQTAWCIDDFTLENGATRLIPGSHSDPQPVNGRTGIQVVAPAGSIIAFDCQAFHAGEANHSQLLRRGVLTLYIRSWLKPQTDHRRSFPTEMIPTASTELLRLLGFRRQSPVELPDGASIIIPAPGATYFYDQPPAGPIAY